MRPTPILVLVATLLTFGCAPNKDGGTEPGASPTPTPSHPEGPQLLSFGSDVTALTEHESVTFSAIVTDPNGPDDVIGGTLEGPGGVIYGNFARSTTADPSYSLTLSWKDLDHVEGIDFDENGSSRKFTARFFDAAGHIVETSAELGLHCDGASAINGQCEFLAPGLYVVEDLIVYENGCNVDVVGLDGSETNVGVDGNDLTLFDYMKVEHDDGTLTGIDSWVKDWNPVFDCVEQYQQVYTGWIETRSEFEFSFRQTRDVSGGNLCFLMEAQEGLALPCETRVRMTLRASD